MAARSKPAGFTLVELAVVLTIVTLLLTSLMYTLSAQMNQRNIDETRRRLDQARELILSYAVVKGRMPCPAYYRTAVDNSAGRESFCTSAATSSTSSCVSSETTTEQSHGTCSNHYDGYLPAVSIGFPQVDPSGFAIDAWGNRIRYAVARTIASGTCNGIQTPPNLFRTMFTSKTYLQTYGMTRQPDDLLICKNYSDATLGTVTGSSCGGAQNQVMSQSLVVGVVFSTGKNGATSPTGGGTDESTNLKTNAALSPQINPIFVFHTPTDSSAPNGEFDDQFTWITIGELYGKLIAAGLLP